MTEPIHRTATEGRHLWFLADLMSVKATASETGGAFALIEGVFPAGDATPAHVHHTDDEAWYVLDGSVRLACGTDTYDAGPGDFLLAPRGIEHSLQVTGEDQARLLVLTFPGAFADFVEELGTPAPRLELPPPAEPDVERLMRIAARHAIEITGPPPR